MTTPAAPTDLVIVNSTIQKPTQIWFGGSGIQPFIINNDEVNTMYIGAQRDILTQQISSCIPVAPLGGMSWPDVDIWAFAPTALNYLIIPGVTAWAPSPVQVQLALIAAGLATSANQASQIAGQNTSNVNTGNISANQFTHTDGVTTGVPATHGFGTDASQVSYTVPAGSSVFEFFNISRPGYYVSISVQTAAAATIPVLGVDMIWQSAATGFDVAQEQWYVMASDVSGDSAVYGKGPTKANSLVIGLHNYDPAQSMTVTFSLYETTHHIARDDWRSAVPTAVPSFTVPPLCDPFAGILGAANATVFAANQTLSYILPLYSGQVWLFNQNSNGNLSISIQTLDESLASNPVVFSTTLTAAQLVPQLIVLPRTACVISFHATAALTNSWHLGILEYAS